MNVKKPLFKPGQILATPGCLEALEQALEGIATGAARLATYIGQREGHGCGDQSHEAAVKESNKVVAKVRRALGYNVTHPVVF